MKVVVSLFSFLLVAACAQAPSIDPVFDSEFGRVAVMQGATSTTEVQFVVAIPKHEEMQIEVVSSLTGKTLLNAIGKSIVYEHSDWKLVQFRLSRLKPGMPYKLKLKGDPGNWVDVREFKTLPVITSHFRVAVVSCARDDLNGIDGIWQQLATEDVDVVLMVGDNSYTDLSVPGLKTTMTKNKLWDRHMETRNRLHFFRWEKLVPVFATWDDHDFGEGNGNRNFELKAESAKIFASFFPMRLESKDFSEGPGVARATSVGHNRFVFFDNRSFRAPKKAKSKRFHFGPEQVQWGAKQIDPKSLNWLISGDQFFGGYHSFESFEGDHPKAFKEFLQKFKENNAPMILLSGDRHMSEIMKIEKTALGRTTYEITSSPIHSSVYPGAAARDKNPRRVSAISGQWNYVILDVQEKDDHYLLQTTSKGFPDLKFFSEDLKIAK